MPEGARRERADRSQGDIRMAKTPCEDWSAIQGKHHRCRRADRAPGRCRAGEELLGGTASPAAFSSRRTAFQTVLQADTDYPGLDSTNRAPVPASLFPSFSLKCLTGRR